MGGDFGIFEFGEDFDAGETVELEVLQLFEGFGGAALEEGTEFDGSFHLGEALLVVGIFEPAVLGFGFEALGAEGLEARVGVLIEEELFGGAAGEGFQLQLGFELFVLLALFGAGGEEFFAGGVETVADRVG